ncbi:MAG: S8 family serine peptidase [Thermodesulfobacteriota bacterium]|nr:S8 family serine peptidase [Thermodesulfobacteriota bacterium]
MNDIQVIKSKNVKWVVLFTLLLTFLSVSVLQAGTVDPELASLIQTLDPAEEVAVIVTLSDQVNLKKFKDKDKSLRRSKIIKALRNKADKTQVNLKKFLKGKKANRIISFWAFNGIAVTIPAHLVNELAGQPGVQSIQLDDTLSQPQPALAGEAVPEWNLNLIKAPLLWEMGITGSGVVVASMDTGVDVQHPDLATSYRGGGNSWFDPHGEHSTPYDRHGHGTQTMGIMVGGSNGGTAIGVAPDAKWIAVKMFDDSGQAPYSVIHLGFQWLLDPDNNADTDDLPDVVNNSWGYRELVGECFTEFQLDIQALKAAGVAVVFSAGNEGPAGYTSVSPANYPESLAVGSVDENLFIADTSSRGPSACGGDLYPQLVAPGVWVHTSDPTFGGVFPNSYAVVSGTSFAAPHVAGSMALLLSADPTLTVRQLESALTGAAVDLGDPGPDNDYGNGLLDAAGAWNLVQSGNPGCTDADGDGFYLESDCGTVQDCDDTNPAVYPGAVEIKHDGIDQDCNGYDLTIEIILAEYLASDAKLNVEATSSLAKNAGLALDGYGPMKWNRKKAKWAISVNSIAQDPGSVTVSGIEGSESVDTDAPVVDPGGDTGGGKGGGKGKKK